jgi:hypothetical protein
MANTTSSIGFVASSCLPFSFKLTSLDSQGFLIGLFLPLIPYILYKKTGKKIWKQINVPLVLHGVCPPLFSFSFFLR